MCICLDKLFLSVGSPLPRNPFSGFWLWLKMGCLWLKRGCGPIRDVRQRTEATSIVIPVGLAFGYSQNGITVLSQGIRGRDPFAYFMQMEQPTHSPHSPSSPGRQEFTPTSGWNWLAFSTRAVSKTRVTDVVKMLLTSCVISCERGWWANRSIKDHLSRFDVLAT